MTYNKQEENRIEILMGYEDEELQNFLDNPQDLETGCPFNCDECQEIEIGYIKEAIRRKELKDEHIREDL